MGKFQKGHKLAKGGKRPGAGRKSKKRKEIEATAEELARKYIEKALKPVLNAYIQFAKGRKVKHRHRETGDVLWTEFEAEPKVTCHFIDKLLPAAKQELSIEHKGKIDSTVIVETVDPHGVSGGRPPQRSPRR